MKNIIIFIFNILPLINLAQNQADSLKKAIIASSPQHNISILNKLSALLRTTNPTDALSYSEWGLSLAIKTNDTSGAALSLKNSGLVY